MPQLGSSCDNPMYMSEISYAEIEPEFNESLGYIRNDIAALCRGNERVNYTLALLIACGCDVIARGSRSKRQAHEVFAELLSNSDWKALAKPLYEALRNGLAHKFDTKHLHVDGDIVQMYFYWTRKQVAEIGLANGRTALFIGTRLLGERLCERIDDFRRNLKTDAGARECFRRAYHRESVTRFSLMETAAWKRLRAAT